MRFMKMFSKQIITPLCLFLAVLFSLSAVLITVITVDDSSLNENNNVTELNSGWYYFNGAEKETIKSLPGNIDKGKEPAITLMNTLPDNITGSAVLCVRTTYQDLQVYIGKELVYDFGTENHVGSKYGSVLNFIDISENQKGQTVTLNISSTSDEMGRTLSGIIIGDKGAVVLYLIKKNLITLIFSILALSLGLMFVIFAVYLTIKPVRLNRNSYLYFGVFLILSAIWIMSDTNIFQLLDIGIIKRYLISFFSFLLLPIPFLQYIKEACTHGKKLFNALCLLFVLCFFVNLYCYLFDIIELTKILFISHTLVLLAIIFILYFSVQEYFKYHSKNMNTILIGTAVLCITSLINLFEFYFSFIMDSSVLFRIGMLFFIMILCLDIFQKSLGLLNAHMEATIYKQLAYTDLATGLRNRAAYDISVTELNSRWGKAPLGLIIFDIDNLKINNDTLGHSVGDELIRGVANCIKETFRNNEDCFRIGGDEFAVMMKEDKEEKIESLLKKFEFCVENYNNTHKHKLSVSCGCAISEKLNSKFNDIYDLFNSADMDMYSNKMKKNKNSVVKAQCAD